MLHHLIKSRPEISDQMIYISSQGNTELVQVLLCQRKISGEQILIKELHLLAGLHLIIIQKLAIKIFIRHQGRCHDTFLVQTELFYIQIALVIPFDKYLIF